MSSSPSLVTSKEWSIVSRGSVDPPNTTAFPLVPATLSSGVTPSTEGLKSLGLTSEVKVLLNPSALALAVV